MDQKTFVIIVSETDNHGDTNKSGHWMRAIPRVGEYVRIYMDRWVVFEVEHDLVAGQVIARVRKAVGK